MAKEQISSETQILSSSKRTEFLISTHHVSRVEYEQKLDQFGDSSRGEGLVAVRNARSGNHAFSHVVHDLRRIPY